MTVIVGANEIKMVKQKQLTQDAAPTLSFCPSEKRMEELQDSDIDDVEAIATSLGKESTVREESNVCCRRKHRFLAFTCSMSDWILMICSSPRIRSMKQVLERNLIPDDPSSIVLSPFIWFWLSDHDRQETVVCTLKKLVPTKIAFKFFKFLSLTISFVCIGYEILRIFQFETDQTYSLRDFFLYDLQYVLLDATVFFFVGRLFLRRGFDAIVPFILPLLLGILVPSILAKTLFKYSLSTYDIMCRWSFEVFLITGVLLMFGCFSLLAHIRFCYCNGILACKLIELGGCILLFLVPLAGHNNFHPHHWYISWLFGMHANQSPWWSQVTLAFMWGYYINGIAAYGRDPLLGCLESYYQSVKGSCNYMDCQFKLDDFWYGPFDDYLIINDDAIFNTTVNVPQGTYGTEYLSFKSHDWRNCDAGNETNP